MAQRHEQHGFGGRAALVLGGATGIGLATAEALCDAGARVWIAGHEASQVESTISQLSADGRDVGGIVADVRNGADMESAVGTVISGAGGLDHMVYCAGIQMPGTVADADEQSWLTVIDVNLNGCYRACHAAIPALRARGGGSIVVVSSIQAMLSKRNGAAYIASKGALSALTRAMALDHAPHNIRVNAVCPGVIDTPLLREAAERVRGSRSIDEVVTEWASLQPLFAAQRKVCGPREVGDVITFLLGDGARYVTGENILVDGGFGTSLRPM